MSKNQTTQNDLRAIEGRFKSSRSLERLQFFKAEIKNLNGAYAAHAKTREQFGENVTAAEYGRSPEFRSGLRSGECLHQYKRVKMAKTA